MKCTYDSNIFASEFFKFTLYRNKAALKVRRNKLSLT